MKDPMMSTDTLAARLNEPGLRVVDASWRLDGGDVRAAFLEARIPGAVFFDIDAIADRTTTLPHMLPSPEAFAEAAGALGVGERDTIVVYDGAGMYSAARVWWTFRTMGADDVFVLDGGLPKWKSEGRRLDSGEPSPQRATFSPAFRPELVAGYDQVLARLGDLSAQIVDARPAARFRADAPEPRAGLRGGHMPGARSLPLGDLIAADGTLKPAGELRRIMAAAGVDPQKPVTASCGSGIAAAGVALALARLGEDRAAVYDGSWAEWGARQDSPIVVGPA